MHDSDVDRLAAEIADYLARHPEAADSLEGVVHWWVGRQRFDRLIPSVEAALERLIAEGIVSCRRAPDGTRYYSRGAGAASRH